VTDALLALSLAHERHRLERAAARRTALAPAASMESATQPVSVDAAPVRREGDAVLA
jgi:hypothetical protein